MKRRGYRRISESDPDSSLELDIPVNSAANDYSSEGRVATPELKPSFSGFDETGNEAITTKLLPIYLE